MMTRIGSLAQLPNVAEVRNETPVEPVEARELALRVSMPAPKIEQRALGLPAPARPSEHAMDALAAAAHRSWDDPRLATMFERARSMLDMRDSVRSLRRGAGRA